MVYELFTKLIKKQIYITFHDALKHLSSDRHVDQFVGKHPLLKPELMIENDSPTGFKGVDEKLRSLERFPIYVEIEYEESDGEKYIDAVEMYSEFTSLTDINLEIVQETLEAFQKNVSVDIVRRLNDAEEQTLVIYSRLSDIFESGDIDEDLKDGLISEKELNVLFDIQITSLLNFVKMIDEKIPLESLEDLEKLLASQDEGSHEESHD